MRQSLCVSFVALLSLSGCGTVAFDDAEGDAGTSPRGGDGGPRQAWDAGWEAPRDAGGWGGADAWVVADAGPPPGPDDAGVPEKPPDPPPDPPPPATVEQTFRVLHWNIAGGKENDCHAPAITAAVVHYVRERDVDFVGLNEVCPSQYRSIRDALRRHWGKPASAQFSAFVGDETGRVVGNAIFSRLNIRDVTRQRVGEDRYGVRNLLCARVRSLPHLRFCSTHLTPGDATARVQLRRIMTRIEGWWADRRDTVILTGDLNLHPNDPGLNAVYASGANHPRNNPNNHGHYREVDDADPDHCRGYGERSLPGTSGGPCHAGGKIDFIFVRNNRIVDGRYSGDTLNIPSTCGGVCSDHRAVLGRVRVRIRNR